MIIIDRLHPRGLLLLRQLRLRHHLQLLRRGDTATVVGVGHDGGVGDEEVGARCRRLIGVIIIIVAHDDVSYVVLSISASHVE